jgi:peroxisomal membrane protein 4
MTFLFRSGSLRDKFAWILRATYTHSKNLATFVLIYKTLMAIMRRVEGGKGNVHPFISAFIGGYFVFGTHDKINEQVSCEIFCRSVFTGKTLISIFFGQIVLYLLSRITVAFAKLAVKEGYISKPNFEVWPWFAAFVWGSVLWLFEFHRYGLNKYIKAIDYEGLFNFGL